MIPVSVLDLAPILEGHPATETFRNSLDLARHAERLGLHRYWLAEHHNMPGIGSSATSVLIGHIASGTKSIRVGSGGIMLPNHSPLVIAEQFGTLESLYPGRIDLGLGRAPGTDGRTARALRRNVGIGSADTFPQDVLELMTYFKPAEAGFPVHAIPGQDLNVPIYLLGSSDFSARLAADLGLPFAFASHFAPEYLHIALELYREHFKPSEQLQKPHAMVAVNVCAADTDDEAQRLFTSHQQLGLSLIRGRPGKLPPPVDQIDWNLAERAEVDRKTRISAVGSPETVRQALAKIIELTQPDELILTGFIYDPAARVHSLEIAAEVLKKM